MIRFLILAFAATLAQANIVELNGFRLAPLILAKKQDFTYSTETTSDEDVQAIRFDLALSPQHTMPNTTYGFMILTADQDTSSNLVDLLTNGTTGVSPADTHIKR